ncbi:sigma-70 family RNA polymerase sigma factor [Pedobacter xixiisoli]|uniref:RNA polymerase sigma-70 factor, ECF subfamily n=1 Tax=Pedobacter xixiisoli TaxID=1476464 RepID=A0A286A0A2_9SPHI|nr:sigma-70 family RNA polymerase sigma factor [Pedobacter xixiisoli]SOD15326.1 RNA polymerase sigma-70 factor, ECF subfamily [Pedobacter xixiisoli]
MLELALQQMKEIADSELLELTKQSSYPAFNELYQRYWKYIYTIAYKKLGDKDDAADLTQNVFMEFYHKRENLVIHIPIKNYLRTAMLYKLSNYFRTKGFQEKHYLNFQQFIQQAQDSDSSFDLLTTKENELEFEEMVELIYRTIDEMPDKMKEIFLMSRSEQYSIVEIADKLGLSPQTIKNQISKAFTRIREAAAQNNLNVTQVVILIWLTQA